jgi:60 kDa SS-A/Ro ribonucleoprotein
MQLNVARNNPNVTHGGVPAFPKIDAYQQLRRSVLACLLWEDQFYESGASIADRLGELSAQVSPQQLAALAIEARTDHNLRHVSLLLLVELAKHGRGQTLVSLAIENTIQRADELSEFVSIYWRNGKTPLSKQVKKGLAAALRKFDAYQLAKYDREKAVRIRDVLFLTHAKPNDEAQAATWKSLVDGKLQTPDTWEVALSGGADKRETFERLLRENNLGYLALLRNLRNMTEAGVDTALIRQAILARKGGAQRVLPFRYVAAARACPQLEPHIDQALSEAISELKQLPGKTIVLVDVSGSMDAKLSAKSDLTRMDAAAALASIINGDVRMFSFSDALVEVPPRRGMAGVDALLRSQPHGGTALAGAVRAVNQWPHDRLIVITDEQATDGAVGDPVAKHAYMVNVASYKNGVGYGKWTHIDGFSEGILRWINEFENDPERAS